KWKVNRPGSRKAELDTQHTLHLPSTIQCNLDTNRAIPDTLQHTCSLTESRKPAGQALDNTTIRSRILQGFAVPYILQRMG
ncbi:MAG: hypothetical protein KDD51_16220, partial [Bdellovibrionales bacterium]|nr:hypothetical protein [Bdellovibrionales bacterium]